MILEGCSRQKQRSDNIDFAKKAIVHFILRNDCSRIMFRDFVSNALPVSGSVQQQLEAVTAERDFFREKYAAQMNEMESLQTELKESRRMIDKLRSQILDLEVERARMAGESSDCFSPVKIVSTGEKMKTPQKNERGSANTSITSAATSVDSTRSSPDFVENDVSCAGANSSGIQCDADALVSDIHTSDSTEEILRCDDDNVEKAGMNPPFAEEDLLAEDDNSTDTDEADDRDESADDEDGADQIRAKAERMLIWANYQAHRRSTPMKDSSNGYETDNIDGDSVTHSEVTSPTSTPKCSISNIPPSLKSSRSLLDDSSSLGSAP